MLSQETFKDFARKFQTSELNVMREYLQNLVLSYLYQRPKSEKIAFKGGTALRLLYQSPRFSEDLDFSSSLTPYHIKNILRDTFSQIEKEAIPFTCLESKTTSGGYLAGYYFELYGRKVDIEFNMSLRDYTKAEPILITTPLIPSYQCMVLPISKLVDEKLEALLRRNKPRDFFDLYFLLRSRKGIERIIPVKNKLLKAVLKLDSNAVKRELRVLLPISHLQLLKSFPRLLATELERL